MALNRSLNDFMVFAQDVNSAIAVHNNMQGAIVTSSDRGGMRLQYPFLGSFFFFPAFLAS